MKTRFIFRAPCLVLFFFAILFSAFAQQDEQNVYIINSYKYHIDGATKEYALDYKTGLKIGEEITGASNLENFIQDKTQLLVNERIFESIRIDHTIGNARRDGKYPVDLDIYLKDGWNVIVFPYPQYSSNSGFKLTLKARDYNFLGTMNPVKVDVGYQHNEEGKNLFSFLLNSDFPFKAAGLYWLFDFDHAFQYRPDFDEVWYYNNTTGISVELPVSRSVITAGFSESIFLNQENPLRYREEYGRFQEGLYLSSNPYVFWLIPTGLFFNKLGEINYTPKLEAVFNHEFKEWPLSDFLKGPFLIFSHSLDLGRVNWIDNFRSGSLINIENSFKNDFYKSKNDIEPWTANLTVSGQNHSIINDYAGLSMRLFYRQWFFDDYGDECADVLRGILDSDINARYMLSLNIDVSFLLFKVRPSQKFDNRSFWRTFDFDIHLVPFIDAALFEAPSNTQEFDLENIQLTAGLEMVLFPQRWQSFYMRISYGHNFSFGDKNSYNELYIGTEFHY